MDNVCPAYARTAAPSRRAVLRAGVAGFAGLNLPAALRAEGSPANRPKAKSVIFLHQFGGPSHLDTFDMKPDAPDGIRVCEHLPNFAKVIGKFAQIRSVNHRTKNHNPATYYSLTGHSPPLDDIRLRDTLELYPAYGSTVAKLAPSADPGVPSFVSYPHVIRDGSVTPGQSASFLGKPFDPFFVGQDPNSEGFKLPELTLPQSMSMERLEARRGLMRTLDRQAELMETSATARGIDAFYDRALTMLASPTVRRAFDLSREDKALRDAYGRTTYGQGCLLARRLVESGVPFVEVSSTGWDTHQDNFDRVKKLSGEIDAPIAALVADLESRGLLDSTLVIWMGEFGRSPNITSKSGTPGRNHYPKAWSSALFGGGIKAGQVVGRTDKDGAEVVERPISGLDFLATVCTLLGIDPTKENATPIGRPIRIVDKGARPVVEVLPTA